MICAEEKVGVGGVGEGALADWCGTESRDRFGYFREGFLLLGRFGWALRIRL